MKKMQRIKRSRILAVIACLCLLVSLICQNVVLVLADVKPTTATVNFSESPYQKSSRTVEIKDIFAISDITVNTGKVVYEITGDKVKISVSDGRPSRVGPHTKTVTIKEENTYEDFPEMIPYNLDGYIGDLAKTDSGYDSEKELYWAVYKGNVTKAECNFYSYKVTYTYTLNVAPQLILTSPVDGKEIRDEMVIEGFAKDENVGDEINVYYAFDNYTESTKGTAYKTNIATDGTEQDIDGTIDLVPLVLEDGIHTLYMWAVDKRGEKSIPFETKITVDTVPPQTPTLTQEPTTPTNGDVNVIITYPTDAAVKEVRIDGGDWGPFDSTAKDGKIVMDENGTVEARGTDLAGNVSEVGKIEVTNIDKIAPENPVIKQEPDNSIPTNGDVKITITYPEDAVEKLYKVGEDGEWKKYDKEFAVKENDKVYAICKDEAGNVSEEAAIEVTNIDRVPPEKPVLKADTTTPTNQSVLVEVTYPDDAAIKEIKIAGSDWQNFDDVAVDKKINMNENGTVEARGIDLAGNVSEVGKLDITNIDRVPPEKPELKADITTPTNQSVSVAVYYPDDAAIKEIRIDGSDWQNFEDVVTDEEIVLDQNGTVEARGTDLAGNVSDIGRLVIANIDNTSPDTPILIPDITEPTNGTVTVTVYYPKDSVIQEVKIGEGDWIPYLEPVVVDENTTVDGRSQDEAGNYSPVGEYVVGNIDTTLPTAPTIITSADETIAKAITATIIPGKDEESGVDRTEYRLEGATVDDWQEYIEGSTIEIKNIGKTTISARTIDKANNLSPVTSKTVTIKEKPKDNNNNSNSGNNNNNSGSNNTGNNSNGNNSSGNSGGKKVTEPEGNLPAVTAVDLSVFISSDKSKYEEGDTITFAIDYKNKSTIAATNIALKAEIPEYTTVSDIAGGTVSGSFVEWKIEKIAANTSARIEYKVSVNKLDKAEVNSSNTVTISSANITKPEDDSSKTIFLLYSNVDNFHAKYIEGYTDNTFRPANNVTRAEVAAMMYNVLRINKEVSTNKSYTDVKSTHWAYECINVVTNSGLFVGYNDGSFHPDSFITRAEFATVLANYLEFKNVEHDKMNFSDVSKHWARNFIEEIYRVKLIEGYIEKGERLFKPDNNISRSEAVTIVNKMLFRGPLSGIEMPFKDVDGTHWAYGHILESALDHNFKRNEDDSETAIVKD